MAEDELDMEDTTTIGGLFCKSREGGGADGNGISITATTTTTTYGTHYYYYYYYYYCYNYIIARNDSPCW